MRRERQQQIQREWEEQERQPEKEWRICIQNNAIAVVSSPARTTV